VNAKTRQRQSSQRLACFPRVLRTADTASFWLQAAYTAFRLWTLVSGGMVPSVAKATKKAQFKELNIWEK
jgi:hypothetical protein